MPQPQEEEDRRPDLAPRAKAGPEKPELGSFADIVKLAAQKRDLLLKIALEDVCELVRFKPGHIELHLLEDAPKD